MTSSQKMGMVLAIGAAAMFGRSASASIVVGPGGYTHDFDFGSDISEFVVASTGANAGFDLAGASSDSRKGHYRSTFSDSNRVASSLIQLADVGVGEAKDFSISTNFKVSDYQTGQNAFLGLVALGADSNATDGSGGYYLAMVSLGGGASQAVRIVEVNGDGGTTATDASFGQDLGLVVSSPALGDTPNYTMTLTGVYAPSGDLTLSFTLTDGTTTSGTATLVDTSPLHNPWFGFRNRTASSAKFSTYYDYLAISAVPEPATMGLLGVGVLMALRRRGGA